jgi:hypothetical protein
VAVATGKKWFGSVRADVVRVGAPTGGVPVAAKTARDGRHGASVWGVAVPVLSVK